MQCPTTPSPIRRQRSARVGSALDPRSAIDINTAHPSPIRSALKARGSITWVPYFITEKLTPQIIAMATRPISVAWSPNQLREAGGISDIPEV